MAPPPHPDGQSLRALAWRWRNELEKSSAGMTDLARLTHVHTLEEARTIAAVKTLADDLKNHADADTIAVIAAALALIRDDGAFTAAQLAGRKSRNSARRRGNRRSARCCRRRETVSSSRYAAS